MSNTRGKLIVLEGPDGSGKTTLSYKIESYIYHTFGSNSFVYSLPYKYGFAYNEIRNELKESFPNIDILQSLMIVNMQQCMNTVVRKALDEGNNVILDRWLVSTLVYNRKGGGNLLSSISNYKLRNSKATKDDNIEDIMKRSHNISLREISENYFKIDKDLYPDIIFYINSPYYILSKHAKDRSKNKNVEPNDLIESVLETMYCYMDFYEAIHGGIPFGDDILMLNDDKLINTNNWLNLVDDKKKHVMIEMNEEIDPSPLDIGEEEMYAIFEDRMFKHIDELF